MGSFTTWDVNTTPGDKGPFAPPPGWDGSSDQYLVLMRQRWADFAYRQEIWCMLRAERYHPWVFSGPFEEQARYILGRCNPFGRNKQQTVQRAVG